MGVHGDVGRVTVDLGRGKGVHGNMHISYDLNIKLPEFPGTLIRRHRIPRPPPDDDQLYTVEDFNVGIQMVMYSKVFQIVVSTSISLQSLTSDVDHLELTLLFLP